MIRSFRNKGFQRFSDRGDPSRLSVPNIARVERILSWLDIIAAPEDADVPGWRFHALTGSQKDRYALSVSGNWRITFGWEGEDAVDVDLEDYH